MLLLCREKKQRLAPTAVLEQPLQGRFVLVFPFPRITAYARRVDPSILAFNLSSRRHPHIPFDSCFMRCSQKNFMIMSSGPAGRTQQNLVPLMRQPCLAACVLQVIIGRRIGGSGARQSSPCALARLFIGEQGTPPLHVQLGQCTACGKAMFKDASDFSSIDGLASCTTIHQVLHRSCYIFYTVSL